MKKLLALLLCLLFPCALALAEEDAPANLSYEPLEFTMAAVGLKLYIPADMEGYDSDMASYDTGFRLDIFDEALGFSMDAYVECGRDLPLAEFAAFYAERNGYGAPQADTLNGYAVQRMTKADDPTVNAVVFGFEMELYDPYYYVVIFGCENEQATALENEILSTLMTY